MAEIHPMGLYKQGQMLVRARQVQPMPQPGSRRGLTMPWRSASSETLSLWSVSTRHWCSASGMAQALFRWKWKQYVVSNKVLEHAVDAGGGLEVVVRAERGKHGHGV